MRYVTYVRIHVIWVNLGSDELPYIGFDVIWIDFAMSLPLLYWDLNLLPSLERYGFQPYFYSKKEIVNSKIERKEKLEKLTRNWLY